MNPSQAIVLFYKQMELHNGLPFDLRLPPSPIRNMATMSDDELDAEIQLALDDVAAGRCKPLEKVHQIFAGGVMCSPPTNAPSPPRPKC